MTQPYSRSFAGGEITPELYGRLDLTKFQTGLALCRNFVVTPHGPVKNRAGFAYVLQAKANVRTKLLPFIYSTSQSFVLEVGDQYIRFHTQGGTVVEATKNITGVTNANPGVVTSAAHGYTNGRVLYLAAFVGGMTNLNGRYVKVAAAAANSYSLTDLDGNNIDTTSYAAYSSGGTSAAVYEISTPYLTADLFDLHWTQSNDVMTIVHQTYQQRQLARIAATNWTLTTFTTAPTISTPGAPTLGTGGPGGGTPINVIYCCTAVAADGLEESLQSADATANIDLTVAGNYVNVDPPTISTAIRYNIYKYESGLYGYIGQTDGTSFKDDNITPDFTQTPPLNNTPFASSGNYPGAVGYFQQRRWFAGTVNKPQHLFGTRSGTESNMCYSIPTRDDDSITARLTARQANTIRHIVPANDLILLSSGAEWNVTTGGTAGPITPSTIDPRPAGYVGASMVSPVVAGEAVIYAQDRGGRLREIKYEWEQQGYTANDLTIMAPHLFEGYTITDMAWSRAPDQVLWVVRSDGVLLGVTYVPEHEVIAWHQHDTEGTFESVAVVPEGSEDVLYVVVVRTINGVEKRFIERKHTRLVPTLADGFFVDAGATYDGAAATTIGGLWHLEGEEVTVLADGAVHPPLTVSGGSITLEYAASKVHIGLGYNADLQTLPLALEGSTMGQGMNVQVNEAMLRIVESSGVSAGQSFDNLEEFDQRTDESYDEPPRLRTGFADITLPPASWSPDGPVCVRQSQPLPLTLAAIALSVAPGG